MFTFKNQGKKKTKQNKTKNQKKEKQNKTTNITKTAHAKV